jgi:serine/threonine protein kinase
MQCRLAAMLLLACMAAVHACVSCDAGPAAHCRPDVWRAGACAQLYVLSILQDVASGMAYLHRRNVLHGDLRSANILLTRDSAAPCGLAAKVADFGLSNALLRGCTHRSVNAKGSVRHMAPEMLRHGRLSLAGDVYAFGIMSKWRGAVASAAVRLLLWCCAR